MIDTAMATNCKVLFEPKQRDMLVRLVDKQISMSLSLLLELSSWAPAR